MLSSPFAFFRGGPAIMASDPAATPTTGITVQACGDAHLLNFGLFGSPERHLVFSVNDFDETLAGPWEWDVKRLGRQRRRRGPAERLLPQTAARGGPDDGPGLPRGHALLRRDAHPRPVVPAPAGRPAARDRHPTGGRGRCEGAEAGPHRPERIFAKARTRDDLAALAKLTETDGTTLRLASRPPLLVPVRELWTADDAEQVAEGIHLALGSYRASLRDDLRDLVEQYEVVDMARKVVGVGSVGTRCYVALLRARTTTTCCSSRSSRQRPPCWNRTCNRAAMTTTASGS